MVASDFPTRSDIEQHQLAALERLFDAIVPANAFYAKRLAAAGLEKAPTSLEAFAREVPLTTKAELAADQRNHPPYGTNLTYPLQTYRRLHQTSSTTGDPLRWLDTEDSWNWMLAGWQEVFHAAGVSSVDRMLVAFSFGPFIGLWMGFDAAAAMGCLTIPGGAMDSVTRLRVILANEVTVLCCTPTYAVRLGEVAAETGVDLSRSAVRRIVVGGEPGASVPSFRKHVETLWPSARLFDHYGMTEVGPVTYQCEHRTDAVHVNEWGYIAEVIDRKTGQPVTPDGESLGELVLTPLGRHGSPVLRYRTGDLVRPLSDGVCQCGRHTRLLAGGIVGRADEMVVVRGVNLYPSAVEAVIRTCPEVAEYRVEIDQLSSMTQIRIQIEPAKSCKDPEQLCRHVERLFRDAYSLRIEAAVAHDLPRFELKARRWIRKTD